MRFFFEYTFFIRFSTKLYVFMRFFKLCPVLYVFFSILKTGHHEYEIQKKGPLQSKSVKPLF